MVLRDGGEPLFRFRGWPSASDFRRRHRVAKNGKTRRKALYHRPTSHAFAFLSGAIPVAAYRYRATPSSTTATTALGMAAGQGGGLSVNDYPLLAVGDVPVIYPYIVDNIGEALQNQAPWLRRHCHPPDTAVCPGRLHDRLTEIHDLLHARLAQDEGAVKQQQAQALVQGARRTHRPRHGLGRRPHQRRHARPRQRAARPLCMSWRKPPSRWPAQLWQRPQPTHRIGNGADDAGPAILGGRRQSRRPAG